MLTLSPADMPIYHRGNLFPPNQQPCIAEVLGSKLRQTEGLAMFDLRDHDLYLVKDDPSRRAEIGQLPHHPRQFWTDVTPSDEELMDEARITPERTGKW